MRPLTCLLPLAIVLAATAPAQELRGVDASFQPEMVGAGVVWRDAAGVARPFPQIARNAGANLVRLRVWNNASGGRNSIAVSAAEAARWRSAGFKVLIDLHYSDTWADPANQTKPAAWAALTGAALETAVYEFTRDAVAACAGAGAPPDYIQIGNEITGGMLWDNGRVGGAFDTTTQWNALAGLLKAGIDGSRAGTPEGSTPPQTIVHIDRGGDLAACRWFYRNLRQRNVDFDIIGLSYYPFFQGELDALRSTMAGIAAEFPQPILIAETGYPWTLGWQDNTHNQVGSQDQLAPGFPATAEGQRAFLLAVRGIVADQPRCLGFVYWAPDWIVGGPGGSAWENVALFDAAGRALPAWEALSPPGPAGWLVR